MPSTAPAAKPQVFKLGQTAEVTGEKGNPLKITLMGVYYHKGDKQHGLSENGTFAAIAYKAQAVNAADGIPAPISGSGWIWRSGGQTIQTTDGAASSPPWSGRVNTPIADQNIQPGEYQIYIDTIDIPAPGGQFIYVNPGEGSQVAWELPSAAAGTGYGPVLKALKVLGIESA